MTGFDHYLSQCQKRIEAHLDSQLQNPLPQLERLYAAMRYSVMGGGKRIRPVLAYASGEALGVPAEQVDPAAAAVELIHAYSLIHDDLPAMDDDDLRRGQPTCHRAFDEATAILAGDGLQALAFEWISRTEHWQPATRLQMTTLLARAAGPSGLQPDDRRIGLVLLLLFVPVLTCFSSHMVVEIPWRDEHVFDLDDIQNAFPKKYSFFTHLVM